MSDKVYRIKPLVWEKGKQWSSGHAPVCYTTETPFGTIRIIRSWDYDADRPVAGWYIDCEDSTARIDGARFKTNPQAMAEVEQWYHERMAAGLVEIQT